MAESVSGGLSGVNGKPWYRAVGAKIWKFFNSPKLTIFVLLTVAIVSIIGTVVEQGKPVESYVIDYGSRWGDVILALRLNDMYHSGWFTSLLTLLMANITVCTIERFPPKWKTLLKQNPNLDPSIIDRLSTRESFRTDGSMDAAAQKILAIFRKKRYRVKTGASKDGITIYAEKGIIGRFGSDVVHLSLFFILTGAIIGSYAGFRDFAPILVGGTFNVPDAMFGLRLDKFWIDYYDTGQIRQYNSVITVVEGGKEVLTKQIWVNEPLYYKGIRFYQSSYGVAWDRIKEAEITLKRLDKNTFDQPFNIGWGELKNIPGTNYSARLVGYVSDFAFDQETRTVFSKSGDTKNPAAQVEVYDGKKLLYTPWLFFNYPGVMQAIPNSRYDLVLTGFRTIPYSGLSINKDPGTNVVWTGCILMGVGFILAFFVYHRRIWVNVAPQSSGSSVKIGGMINKNPLGFEREFKEIAEALKGPGSMEDKK